MIFEKIAASEPVNQDERPVRHMQQTFIRWIAAAVIILSLISITLFEFYKPSSIKEISGTITPVSRDILPGRAGAILTLADGSKMMLDSLQKNKKVQQGGTSVVLDADHVAYHPNTHDQTAISYNLLEVPRGRQFQLVLPDGTKVWLNAASSLRYPTAFPGSERVVEISGEAYFEVTHDASKPFVVRKGNSEIRVLGTRFNAHAYDDEDGKIITLLEGSVMIKDGDASVTISPGQQARIAESISVTKNVDVDEVVAWKDGRFHFGETTDIKTVMHQIANWYDVDVVYKGTVTDHIGGTISRSVSLSQLLKFLQTTGVVNFKVEGRTIEVSPH